MFYACSNLKSVHLPSGLTSIGNYAFDACSSLDNVFVPEKVTSIGSCALRLAGPNGKYAARYVYFANPGLNWTGEKVFGEPGEVSYPLMRIIVDSSMKSKCQAEASALGARFFTNKEMGTRQLAFDANGGSGALAAVNVVNGMGYALPICPFTNDGGDFVSWNVNGNKFQPGQVVTLKNDSIVQAEWSGWSGGSYTVTFNPNGGSGAMSDMLVQKGKAFTLPVCTFEAPAGSVFQGWDVYVYGNHVSYKEGAKVNPGNVASVPVKALWAAQRTITFDAAGGKVSPATMKTNGKVLATSKMVHAATAGGKVGNYRKVTTKAKKGKVSIAKGKSFKLAGKAVAASKKLKVKNHRKPVVLYESTNPKVAKVSKKGVVKGVAAGTCYVYAYTQTGVFARVKVTVKKATSTSKQTSLQGGIVQLAKIEGGRNVDG